MSAAKRRLALYVSVDGTQYGPDDDLPADVAAKITNPDAWWADSDDAPSSATTQAKGRQQK